MLMTLRLNYYAHAHIYAYNSVINAIKKIRIVMLARTMTAIIATVAHVIVVKQSKVNN